MIIPVLFGAGLPGPSVANRIGSKALNDSETQALYDVAKLLSIPPEWLYSVVTFESQWDPFSKTTGTSARGLIGFTDAAAQELGYTSSAALIAANPSREAQLRGPVYHLLKRFGPYKRLVDIPATIMGPYAGYKKYSMTQTLPSFLVKQGVPNLKTYLQKMQNAIKAWPFSEKVAFMPPTDWKKIAAVAAPIIVAMK